MGNTGDDKSVRVWGWRRGVSRLLMAAALLVMALSVSSDSQNDMAQEKANGKGRPGSIAGRITIQGKPAPGLTVALLPQWYHILNKAIATTNTGDDGSYRLTDLPANHYWLKVLAPEYVGTGEWYKKPGRRVTVADGELAEDADLDLLPGGVISGTITDVDGNPVAGERVQLTQVGEYHPWFPPLPLSGDDFQTDSKGAYRFYGIPPGRYLVSIGEDIARLTGAVWAKYDYFGPSGRVGRSRYYEQTFYPGVASKAEAHSLEVTAGDEVKDINFIVGRTLRSYTASGRVVDAQTGEPVRNCRLDLSHRVGKRGYTGSFSEETDSTDENGDFQISGLLPGRFFVRAYFEGDTDLYTNTVDFEIRDEDITGVIVKAYRGVTLSGSISVEGNQELVTAQLSQLKLSASLAPDRRGHGYIHREASVNSDGSFEIRGLRPGLADLSLGSSPIDHYFSVIRIEYPKSQGERQMEIVPVTPSRRAHIALGDKDLKDVRVTLAYDNAIIRGRVKVVSGKLASDMRLQARISRRFDNGSSCWTPEVDANGYFQTDGLEPGEYQVSICDGSKDLSEIQTITLMRNAEVEVSFVLDLAARKEKD